MAKDLNGKTRGNAGFTLMELIIVIAILAMLIGMLLPRFANYTDKAMGAVAGSDTKKILTVASAYNLDNSKPIGIGELQKQMGIDDKGTGGKFLRGDAAQSVQFTYSYIKGGASIVALIDVQSSIITYVVQGADKSNFVSTGTDAPDVSKQAGRIAKGLGF